MKTKKLNTCVIVYLDEKENVTNVTSTYDNNEIYQQPLNFKS